MCALYLLSDLILRKSSLNINRFRNEINAIIPIYALKLCFVIWKIDIDTQKIDDSAFITYRMIIIVFLF